VTLWKQTKPRRFFAPLTQHKAGNPWPHTPEPELLPGLEPWAGWVCRLGWSLWGLWVGAGWAEPWAVGGAGWAGAVGCGSGRLGWEPVGCRRRLGWELWVVVWWLV